MNTTIIRFIFLCLSLPAFAESPVEHGLDDWKSFNILANTLQEIEEINSTPPNLAVLLCLYKGENTYSVRDIGNFNYVVRVSSEDGSQTVEFPINKVRKTFDGNIRIWAENLTPVECLTLTGYRTK